LLLNRLAQAFFLLPEFGSELGADVLRFEYLANFDLGTPSNAARFRPPLPSTALHSQEPAISSLVSVKGPSITVRFGPENRTRLPLEVD
jgi:hypothetical protein